jgi:hypothetical protein
MQQENDLSTSGPAAQQPQAPGQYPLAAIAYYGPDDQTATRVVVAIVDASQAILDSSSWMIESGDIRFDEHTSRKIAAFVQGHDIEKVVIAEGILGCPHVPGQDYPLGESCPYCPFWAEEDS